MVVNKQADRSAPILSIVVVNSDGTEDTIRCLDSIYSHPPDECFEVIVVDNRSRIPSLPIIHERYPHVRTFSAPQRQGFSKNYNLGIRQAHGMYVLILNNDTFVHPGALNTLLSAVREEPLYCMVGGKLLSRNGQIQWVCARALPTPSSYACTQLLVDPGFPLGRMWDRYLRWQGEKRASGPVPCISGACMLITRDALQTGGLLDEAYDFYYEDVEWCHRFQSLNMMIAYISEAEITHFGDQSLSKVKVWAKKSEYQSAIRYFREYHNLSAVQMWLLWSITTIGFLLRGAAFLLSEALFGKRSHARAYLFLWQWILRQRPDRASYQREQT